MKPSEAHKQYMLAHGWQYKGSCNCSGMRTLKFDYNARDGEYKIRLRTMHFLLSTPGQRFTKFSIVELKEKIDELYNKNAFVIAQKAKI